MIRGILALMMLLAAYSFLSFDEGIAEPSDIDYDEATVSDVRDDASTTYNWIHLHSDDPEWATSYYDNYGNEF